MPCSVTAEEKCATQLAHLASQHHGSEYNRLKFGPQGCPIIYVPLSIHMPDYVRELQARQTMYTEQKAWWPCQKQETLNKHSEPHPSAEPPIVIGPCGTSIPNIVDLQREISAAISEPLETLPLVFENSLHHPQVKTSDSHPINISVIIPQELLPILSSHLVATGKSSPTMFDVPPAYSLDCVTSCQNPPTSASPPRSLSLSQFKPCGQHSVSFTTNISRPLNHWRTRSSVGEAIQAAINGGLAAATREIVLGNVSLDSSAVCPESRPVALPTCTMQPLDNCGQTSTCPNRQERAYSAPPIMLDFPVASPCHENHAGNGSTSNWELEYASDSQNHTMVPSIRSEHTHPPLCSLSISSTSTLVQNSYAFPRDTYISKQQRTPSIPPYSQHLPHPSPSFSLGNILLSSCPGKKVRLTGPVKGRSGVCRDLYTDLKRMRDLGVGCVICCLDDNELEFLGVPWTEYSRAAQEVGVDVLRIPIPEGLTPPSPASLDLHLTHVIRTYTMQGIPILAHCRGGVGRAGLVACCWMLKLGLCGWIETDLRCQSRQDAMSESADGVGNCSVESGVRRDTMQLVERAIAVVRKRRSIKAVETYEQVKFLVDFVEYLRETPTTMEDL